MSEPAAASRPQAAAAGQMPRQIPYIIGNEACERFSFYGMRNILTPFLVTSLLLYAPEAERAGIAKDVFHTFVIGVYFFPLLGGWISDRFFGKYRTILWLSLVYCAGHACLAAFEDYRPGFYTGRIPLGDYINQHIGSVKQRHLDAPKGPRSWELPGAAGSQHDDA